MISNTAAAGVATIASGPFNYVRNMQYATQPHLKPPTIAQSLSHVWNESKIHNQSSLGRLHFFSETI